MNILFASPDRDLVRAYQTLLESEGHRVSPAYDGIQVVEALAALHPKEAFGCAVLDKSLPRVSLEKLMEEIQTFSIPLILLSKEKEGPEPLGKTCFRLTYPFEPSELFEAINTAPPFGCESEDSCYE